MSDETGQFKEAPAAPYCVDETKSPYAALADELYRERVMRARNMSPEEKLLAGESLFYYACSITLAGIHNDFPEANEEQCLQILRDRLAWRERREWMEAPCDR